MRVRQYSPRRLISKAAIRPRDGMLQTIRVQPLRSLARSASIITLTILSLTTCELGKLFGPTTPPATKLVFQVQPQSALAGVAFTSAVKVYVSDALGDTVTDATNAITIGITPSTGTAGAILNGTTTASATAGVATFTNINVDRAGTGYTLTASATPLTPAVSSAFVVVVPPTIVLTPSSRAFTAAVGGASPAPLNVAVTNSGGGTLAGLAIGTITYGAGGTGWLAATITPATAPATVTLTATTGALAAGTYTATVPVTSTAANVTNSPQNLAVTFTVSQAPTITLSATSRTFLATPGFAPPATQTVGVTNTGTGTLSGLAIGTITYGAGGAGWLAATLDVTTAPATITLTATTGPLAAGTYTATVPVTSAASGVTNSPQNITVTFTLAPLSIVLTPTSLTFTATAGGSNPATNTVVVSNGGGGTLNGLAIGTITYGAAGATGWLAASLGGTIAPATVTLTPTTGSLTAGSYTATVPVTSSAAGVTNSPQNISVTFIVNSGTPNTWTTLTPMTNARFGSAAEVISGVMYVAGGNGGSGDTPTLQAYTAASGTWQQLTSMLGGRYTGDGAGVINSELYVPGGWTTSPGLPNSNLFIYTPSSNVWRSGASMPTLSGCGGNGVINNKLYVTTACDGSSGYRNFLHVYDPTTNAWTALPSTLNAHSGPATGVIGGKLYVAGGFNGTLYSTSTSLEVYDPALNTWTTKAPMTAGREGASGAVVNGKLYVFGGTTGGGTPLNTVEVYDPLANTWTTLAAMPTSRFYTSIGVINGIIYVVGGSNAAGPLGTLEAYRP